MNIPEKFETDRLIIRPFKETDLEGFKAFMLDEEATRFVLFSEDQKTEFGAEKIFTETMESYSSKDPIFALAVEDKNTSQYIGSVGLMLIDSGCEVYWSINREHWNKGYGTEATKALIDYIQTVLNIPTIIAHTHPDNIGSYKVAEKCGFTFMGIVPHPFTGMDARLYILKSNINAISQ